MNEAIIAKEIATLKDRVAELEATVLLLIELAEVCNVR